MDGRPETGASLARGRTDVERTSERELVVRRTFDAPARLVFEAWTRPELFTWWWAPKSSGVPLLSCEMDVRREASTAWSSDTMPQAPGPSSAGTSTWCRTHGWSGPMTKGRTKAP